MPLQNMICEQTQPFQVILPHKAGLDPATHTIGYQVSLASGLDTTGYNET